MKFASFGAVLACVLSGAAFAQNLLVSGGMTIEEVGAILESEGLSVTMGSGGQAGSLSSVVSGAEFEVETYHCGSNRRCTEFLFIAGFDLANGFPIERINKWNAEELAGRAFLDKENDPFLDHVVSVSGPADENAFREGLYLWAGALDAYLKFIELPGADVEPDV